MQIEGGRVIYNSATVALGTGVFCSLVLSLIGYYLISNSFRRDILSRTGLVIAATPVTNARYVVGKFFGNALYLGAIIMGCMLSAMVMFLIRGETAIQPLVFLTTFVWILIPTAGFCAAIALVFESVPALSGRAGDVIYFFLWAGLLAVPIALFENGVRLFWIHGLDIVGLVPVLEQLQSRFHTTSMSIGSTSYDASRPAVLFSGIEWSWRIIGERFLTIVLPAGLLAVAAQSFHRFNPAKIKLSARHSKRNLMGWLNALLKPVTRHLQRLVPAGGRGASMVNSIRADVLATLALSPLTTLAMLIIAVLSISLDVRSVREGVVPVIVVALVMGLADCATRDSSGGMMNLLFTAPGLKRNYVFWKLASALALTFCFTLIPIIRMWSDLPSSGVSLLIGSFFLASAAVGLGILARSQKAFIALILMILYISLSAANEPALDFAGIHANATGAVQVWYGVLSVGLVLAGAARHAVRARRG